jgi:hypothetical protein
MQLMKNYLSKILLLVFLSLNFTGKTQDEYTILKYDSTTLSQLDSASLAKLVKIQENYLKLMTPPILDKEDTLEVEKLLIKYFKKLNQGGGYRLKRTFISSRNLIYINPVSTNLIHRIMLYSAWREQFKDFKHSSELLSQRLLIKNKNYSPTYTFELKSQSTPVPEKKWKSGSVIINLNSNGSNNKLVISISKIKRKWKIDDENFQFNGRFNLIYNSKKFRKAGINFKEEVNKIDELINKKDYGKSLLICEKLMEVDPNELILLSRYSFLKRVAQ